jgi:hypothetical protein
MTQQRTPLPLTCTYVKNTGPKFHKDQRGIKDANNPATHLAVIFGEHVEQERLHIIIKCFVVKKQFR